MFAPLVIDSDDHKHAELGVIPSDLLVDAVGVNVGEGISREATLLPFVGLGLPLDFEGGDDAPLSTIGCQLLGSLALDKL
nr:hypothetical protein [Ferrimicrobium acidiphilum]